MLPHQRCRPGERVVGPDHDNRRDRGASRGALAEVAFGRRRHEVEVGDDSPEPTFEIGVGLVVHAPENDDAMHAVRSHDDCYVSQGSRERDAQYPRMHDVSDESLVEGGVRGRLPPVHERAIDCHSISCHRPECPRCAAERHR
jgi:hypothetical protein